MDQEMKKLTWIQIGNWSFNLSVYSFCLVYLVKYCNMMLDVSRLNVANMVIALVTICMLQIVKRDDVLDVLSNNIVILLIGTNILEWLIVATILYDPLIYMVGMAVFKGTLMKMTSATFQDLHNVIYKGRERTKFGQLQKQCECIGLLIGGILGWFVSDLPLVWVVVLGFSARVIDIPLSLWRLKIMRARIARLGLTID